MQIHELKSKTKFRRGQRIGRGGKRGTTSGKGTKGQKARAGAKIRPAEREILKKIPKLRGYRFKSFRLQPAVVNLKDIEKRFSSGTQITPRVLHEAGLVRKIKGKMPAVKILGTGTTEKKFTFKEVTLSRNALHKLK